MRFLLLMSMVAWTCSAAVQEIVVTQDLVLEPKEQSARLIVRASHVTIDGQGATLIGPGQVGDPKSLESAGIGVLIEGASDVKLKNLRVHGFSNGLVIRR